MPAFSHNTFGIDDFFNLLCVNLAVALSPSTTQRRIDANTRLPVLLASPVRRMQ